MIGLGNKIVDGVSFVTGKFIVNEDGSASAVTPVLANGTQSGSEIAASIAITREPVGVVYSQISAIEGGNYNIYGSVVPVGSIVYLSDTMTGSDPVASMGESIITSCRSNPVDGSFIFRNLSYDTIPTSIVWTHFALDVEQVTQVNLTAEVEIYNKDDEKLLHTTDLRMIAEEDICPDCNATGLVGVGTCGTCIGRGYVGNPNLEYVLLSSVDGYCPSDAEYVYLSAEPTEMTVEALGATVQARATPTMDSEYVVDERAYWSINEVETATGDFVVWCQSDQNNEPQILAIRESSSVHTAICLSGDTLITMADGTHKQMQDFQVGDLVMSGDLTPTKVVRLARGIFNSYHTLYHFDNGTVIDEVHTHRFYNVEQGFFQTLERWNIGEHAKIQNGSTTALIKVERIDERKEMFGLWTESHDYWAGGLLTGDLGANQKYFADATAEQAADMAASISEASLYKLLCLGGSLFP